MILYLMLVALGSFLACFIFVLIAPSFWSRAVRLTRRRIESTMPLTISEIEAEKDQLRASFAVKIRRLESALGKSREKSSHQLVEISRMQMGVTTLKDEIASLERSLNERRNAASVFEMTIKKRFPELENALAASQASLAQRSYEASDLNNKLRRREEALALAQRSAGLQQAEITRLREAMEKSGADKSARFKKRPSQWNLDEYRAEYDRLNVELSKLREQLSGAYDREANQTTFLKAELQQLAEQIIAASPLPEAPREGWEADNAPVRPADKRVEITQPRAQTRRPNVERSLARPQPWLKSLEAREPAEADNVATAKAQPGSARVRLQNTGIDDFADKSLQEVLEAALPLSGEAVVVREVVPVEPQPKSASSLTSPVLNPESLDTIESSSVSPGLEADVVLKPQPEETVATPQPQNQTERKSLRALFEVNGAASEAQAPVSVKAISGIDEPSEASKTSVANEEEAEKTSTPTKAPSESDKEQRAQAGPTEIDSAAEEPQVVSTKRTLLERLRGMDDRAG